MTATLSDFEEPTSQPAYSQQASLQPAYSQKASLQSAYSQQASLQPAGQPASQLASQEEEGCQEHTSLIATAVKLFYLDTQ